MTATPTIHWTRTDEAPLLATYSLLPIVRAFTAQAGVRVELADISLAGRILATFPEILRAEQRLPDALAELGALATRPEANIIKLPNISASVPQLIAAIAELRAHGYAVPEYPATPANAEQQAIKDRYAKVLGSAVNPVLREGNSDRRCAASIKQHARQHPHKLRPWPTDSKTRVAHMSEGDFFASEQSTTFASADVLRIEFTAADGAVKALKENLKVLAGEIVDAAVLSVASLRRCYADAISTARAEGVLLSLHLKATMMKVSDPVLFGHMVSTYFSAVVDKHAAALKQIGFNPDLGLGDLETKLSALDGATADAIRADIAATIAKGPGLAMVNSDKGITNLHVSSDVIIDASMPPLIRDGGVMWNAAGKAQQTLAVIPDRSYATMYQAAIDDHKAHGAMDPTTIGSVANVGLMAKKSEEYGSHDKTFVLPAAGKVRILAKDGRVVFEHAVAAGDIWRACQTKDEAIRDWVRLAVTRARLSGQQTIFWLDRARAHDRELIRKVETYLKEHDTTGLDISIQAPAAACAASFTAIRAGKDVISVTGNVLRDYLTDLFPILEIGTSAKMLSIVPLLAGGGLFETGAGGSAPKHVQQFVEENYLRWDSLGEFLALQVSLEDLGQKTGNTAISALASALDQGNARFLQENKSPTRAVGGLDNRGSHAWLAIYWAEALAAQTMDAGLAKRIAPIAKEMAAQAATIEGELIAAQGKPVDIGGYFQPDAAKATAAMRPSATFNALVERLAALSKQSAQG